MKKIVALMLVLILTIPELNSAPFLQEQTRKGRKTEKIEKKSSKVDLHHKRTRNQKKSQKARIKRENARSHAGMEKN